MPSKPPVVQFADREFTAPDLLEILDAVADGISVQDGTGRLIYVNPAAAKIAGFESAEEMAATPSAEIMKRFELSDESGRPVPADRLPSRRALAGAREPEQLLRFRVRATGEERWSLIRSRPVLDADGSVRLVISGWHDVTERVRQQQRTEHAVERQRFLAEAGRLLAASLDPEATMRAITQLAVPRIADWATVTLIDDESTPRQLAVAHADPEKLQFALDLQKRFPPDDAATVRVVRTGKSELYSEIPEDLLKQSARDAEHLRLLQELQLRSAMIVPMKIRDQVLGTISFIGAESGRRYDQDDLEFAESLAARAALAITNARLYREAQEANRAKADFLAVMSHELRTPLTAIFGYTQLLSTEVSGPLNEKQKSQLDRVRASGAHLLSIIEDILNYARSEAGRDEVRAEPFQLSHVINEAVELVRMSAETKKLRLERTIPVDCRMHSDLGKLRQILINLLSNAVKFTESGTVSVRAACVDEDTVVIEVADTGPGIAGADLERIFEPFRQLESATTRTAGGTGLGLAVTRRFAELLGGRIEVRSVLGKGTVFTVVLPLEVPVPH